MYLKSLKISNFRKFGEENNIIEFVDSKDNLNGDINIASASTLIVGKNNSGKTTITKALEKIIKIGKFESNDFNFSYLRALLEEYKQGTFDNFPILSFKILVGIDSTNNQDLVTNYVPFMNIENIEQPNDEKDFSVLIKYELKETTTFLDEVKKLVEKYNERELPFQKFLELISNSEFDLNYYDSNNEKIIKTLFKLSNLINIEIISANKVIDENSLSKTFTEIIKYKAKSENINLEEKIEAINTDMTEEISSFNTESVNNVLHEIEDSKRFKVKLSANLTFEKLMTNLIKYEYTEENLDIPEGQFGLGYANLMTIIGQLIQYIEKYPNEESHSKLNLICIEEPEAFMHPQMQELFIKNINNAVQVLLNGSNKKINSQLVITTHSSHILNSKIHTSNSFNNINYIAIVNNLSYIINLNDEKIIEEVLIHPVVGETPEAKLIREEKNTESRINNLKYLKKHIKFKVSEIFFSDAIIFVEGITEETLLSYYIYNDDNLGLSKYYITIFNINGAHGLKYHNLIKQLRIPTLIITDIDIKRTDEEKAKASDKDNPIFEQIKSLSSRVTTNSTIIKYKGNENLEDIPDYFEDENLYITFQKEKINDCYATSLEESLILSNYDNTILNNSIKEVKPNIYKEIVGEDLIKKNLSDNSYKLQKKLSDDKSNFANTLLYQFSINENIEDLPTLPKYINDSIVWLKNKLNNSENEG